MLFPQHTIPSKPVLGRYWFGFSSYTALRHGTSRVSGKFEDRTFVRTMHFSVSTDASTRTVHKLKLSQTDYRTRMKRPTIYVCPGSFPGEMSRRTARSFKFNYSNPNTNVRTSSNAHCSIIILINAQFTILCRQVLDINAKYHIQPNVQCVGLMY